jgi:hypothetical protein
LYVNKPPNKFLRWLCHIPTAQTLSIIINLIPPIQVERCITRSSFGRGGVTQADPGNSHPGIVVRFLPRTFPVRGEDAVIPFAYACRPCCLVRAYFKPYCIRCLVGAGSQVLPRPLFGHARRSSRCRHDELSLFLRRRSFAQLLHAAAFLCSFPPGQQKG